MNNQSIFFRLPLLYGAVAGVLTLPLIITLYKLGHHPFLILVFFDYRILVFSISMAGCLATLRRQNEAGSLHFWQGMLGNSLIILSFTAIASSLLYLYIAMTPDFVNDFITLATERMKQLSASEIAQLGQANYQYSLSMIGKVDSAFMLHRFIIQSLIIGAPISIIIATLMRKSPDPKITR